ncbi:MAG: trigger factor [Actinomycetota bacterium]|nr:trigger factor [Actinomycetota bacterium]
MQSAVETVSPTRVRLTVEVPFDELAPDLDRAYRTIGKQVKVQGFRPGKVPARILDQRVGRGYVLEEAVQGAIPRLYGEAVQAESLTPLGQPEVEVKEFSDGEKLTFTAEVDVRPDIALPAFDALSVTVEAVSVREDEVTEQLDSLLERFATLTTVERAARDDDYVSLDLVATVGGAEVPGGSATGLSYRVGSGELLDGIDDAVRGTGAGDTTSFQTVLVAGGLEGKTADVAVTVRSVSERVLPVADDTWAQESAGFETVAALRADITSRLDRAKRLNQGVTARDKVLETLLLAVEVPLPEGMVEVERDWRRRAAEDQLSRAGLSTEGWLESEGKTEAEWDAEILDGAVQAVKAQLVLDAIADAEQLGVTDAELTDQVVRRATRAGISPDEYAQSLVQSGQLGGLVAEVRRGKALATVMEAARIEDSNGAVVDLEKLRDDLTADAEDDVELDDDGRRFHVHDDGTVHYFDPPLDEADDEPDAGHEH